jgi:hypothetical protein
MITKMSGEGTGGGPQRPVAVRVLTTVGAALVVVLVASRVNRPTGFRAIDELPKPADEVLPHVQLKTRSVQDLVESINRVAKEKVRLSPTLPAQLPGNDDVPDPLPLHNVRLETALALGLKPWAFLGQRDGTIFDKSREMSKAPVEGRLYDVRDILSAVDRWEKPLWPIPSVWERTHPSGPISGYGPLGDYAPARASLIASLIQSVVLDNSWNSGSVLYFNASGWGGWVYVRATPYHHRNVELLLMLLRRGDSQAALLTGSPR